jgi:nitrogen regulatory protein P-II 1
MKEIKALVHANRIAGVIAALAEAGFLDPANPHRCRNLNVGHTQSLLGALDAHEQHYSVNLGQLVINEAKLELLCEDTQAESLVKLIADAAKTGQDEAGWVYAVDVAVAVKVTGHTSTDHRKRG